jgi:hypothetical protein
VKEVKQEIKKENRAILFIILDKIRKKKLRDTITKLKELRFNKKIKKASSK